jgi:primosomal replication protein N
MEWSATISDRASMSGVICEPRIAVMILVKASWENEAGMLQTVPARIEDRSSGGACLRLKARVGVGSKLNVEGRNEQFSGIARYCRRDGMD